MKDMRAIVAMTRNGVIGHHGKLPWRTIGNDPRPELSRWARWDMKHFREMTTGGTLIMGRKTWESIGGKPLPDRHHIVLSKSKTAALNAPNAPNALNALNTGTPERRLWVCGGGEIYELLVPQCWQVVVSVLKRDMDGDTRFPWDIEGKTFRRMFPHMAVWDRLDGVGEIRIYSA